VAARIMTTIRAVTPQDAASWLRLRRDLWPGGSEAEHAQEIAEFLAGRAREPLQAGASGKRAVRDRRRAGARRQRTTAPSRRTGARLPNSNRGLHGAGARRQRTRERSRSSVRWRNPTGGRRQREDQRLRHGAQPSRHGAQRL